MRLCRYAGANHRGHNGRRAPLALTNTALVVDRRAITGLSHDFDSLPPMPLGMHCPKDDGSSIVAHFSYSNGRHQVPVAVSLTGCRSVSNGYISGITSTTAAGNDLLRRLNQLV